MAGVKGRSGRKRNIRNILDYFNSEVDLCSQELVDITIKKALDGDREMIIYCWDRRLGKPKQQTELTGKGGSELGEGLMVKLFQMIADKQRELYETRVVSLGSGVYEGEFKELTGDEKGQKDTTVQPKTPV